MINNACNLRTSWELHIWKTRYRSFCSCLFACHSQQYTHLCKFFKIKASKDGSSSNRKRLQWRELEHIRSKMKYILRQHRDCRRRKTLSTVSVLWGRTTRWCYSEGKCRWVNLSEQELLRMIKQLAVIPFSVFVQRSDFLSTRQDLTENIGSFAARLKGKTSTCSYPCIFPKYGCNQVRLQRHNSKRCHGDWSSR